LNTHDSGLLRRAEREVARSSDRLVETFVREAKRFLSTQGKVDGDYVRDQGFALLEIMRRRMREAAGPDAASMEQIAALARAWPQHGLSLAAATRGAEVAARDLFIEIRDHPAAELIGPEGVSALQDLTWEWTLQTTATLLNVEREQATLAARRDLTARIRFVRDLSHDRLSPTAVRETAALLGLNPDDRYHAVVAPDHADSRAALEAALRTTGATPRQRVVQVVDRGEHLALAARPPTPPDGTTLGIGSPVALSDAAASFAEARAALRASLALGFTGGIDLVSLGPYGLLVAGDPFVRRLEDHYFGDLPRGFDEVERTVYEYLARDQNVDATARFLGVHRNTVRQRLDRYTATTGLDLRVTRDLILTWWLVHRRRCVDDAGSG
jgi:PucR C-terminal helix-turn-helix domain